jgi:hypothetical protein
LGPPPASIPSPAPAPAADQRTSEVGVEDLKSGMGHWDAWLVRSPLLGKKRAKSNLHAGRPACLLQEMKGRAHGHNGCFWRFASLKQPAKTARRSQLDAPGEGPAATNNLRAEPGEKAGGVQPGAWDSHTQPATRKRTTYMYVNIIPQAPSDQRPNRPATHEASTGTGCLVGCTHQQRAFAPIRENGIRLFLHNNRDAMASSRSVGDALRNCGNRGRRMPAEWLCQMRAIEIKMKHACWRGLAALTFARLRVP